VSLPESKWVTRSKEQRKVMEVKNKVMLLRRRIFLMGTKRRTKAPLPAINNRVVNSDSVPGMIYQEVK
jgi:hypothetical protein